MESFFYVSLVALAISTLALLIAIWVGQRMTDKALEEIKALRQDLEARFEVKFSEKIFSEDDAFSLFLAVGNSLHRFDRGSRLRGDDPDLVVEAKGYIAILKLLLSWAESNRNEGIRRKAKEYLERAENTYQRMMQL